MKKIKQGYIIIGYAFFSVMTILGGVLGLSLAGKEAGAPIFDFATSIAICAIGPISGGIISYFFMKWNKKRNGNIPDIDERSLVIMKRYLLIVLYFVLFVSGALLLLLYGMGVYTIETGMLIVYMMILYILIGIGAIVVKQIF